MANHGKGHFKVAITDEELERLIDRCNCEHFETMLECEVGYAEDGNYFVVKADDQRVFECWLKNEMTLEFRHGHNNDVAWWIDGFLSSYIVEQHGGGTITDDGHGDVMEPDFHHRYPKYTDWLEMKTSHMGWLKKKAWYKWIAELDDYDYCQEFLTVIKEK